MAETKSAKPTKALNIPQKLVEIAKLVDVLKKEAKSFVANYVDEEAILVQITLGLKQQNLEIYPMIVPNTLKVIEQNYITEKTLKDGTIKKTPVHESIVMADLIMRWINLDDTTETMDIPWAMIGQQADSSFSFGGALTYSLRYFYLKFFHVATTKDDPDAFRSKQAQVEDEQSKAVIKAIIDEINDLVGEYIGKDKDKEKTKDIKKFLLDNNNDDMDYTKIKDAEIASALRAKVKDFVRGKTEE